MTFGRPNSSSCSYERVPVFKPLRGAISPLATPRPAKPTIWCSPQVIVIVPETTYTLVQEVDSNNAFPQGYSVQETRVLLVSSHVQSDSSHPASLPSTVVPPNILLPWQASTPRPRATSSTRWRLDPGRPVPTELSASQTKVRVHEESLSAFRVYGRDPQFRPGIRSRQGWSMCLLLAIRLPERPQTEAQEVLSIMIKITWAGIIHSRRFRRVL